jgi:hypothetical protein
MDERYAIFVETVTIRERCFQFSQQTFTDEERRMT